MSRAATLHDRKLLERLSAYLDGDLPASECDDIAAHASTCARCGAILDDLRRTTGLCRRAATEPLPDAVRRRARIRIRELVERDVPASQAVQNRHRTRQRRESGR